jgi:2-desacetyl-2-hydroxyethyl bacteriochlorophyllide A dehydrogenase
MIFLFCVGVVDDLHVAATLEHTYDVRKRVSETATYPRGNPMSRSAAYVAEGKIETREVDPVDPKAGEVQVRVAYVGLCGTDLHIYHGHMDKRVTRPLTFGHEMSGTVEAVGKGVDGWAPGDAVTVMPLKWDGTCAACHAGHHYICQHLTFIGIDSPGALQELWTVPESTLVRLPAGLDLRTAALAEPTAVAVHDVRRSGLQTGDKAVVLGGGPIGLLIACVARDAGAHVMVVELDSGRRALAASLGFATADPAGDVAAAVAEWTGGNGAEVVFEVSGAAPPVALATALAKVRGTIVVVAIHSAPREVNLQQVFWKELTIVGARVYQRSDFERAVDLLAREVIPAGKIITRSVPLEDTADALSQLAKGEAMKVLVDVASTSQEN